MNIRRQMFNFRTNGSKISNILILKS